jgi:hypothetical protein
MIYYNDLGAPQIWEITQKASKDPEFNERERKELEIITYAQKRLQELQDKIKLFPDSPTFNEDAAKYDNELQGIELCWKALQGNQGMLYWNRGSNIKFKIQGYEEHEGYFVAAIGVCNS